MSLDPGPGAPLHGGFRAELLVPGPLVGGRRLGRFEGRWTVQAAVEEGLPAPVLAASLFDRFASRGEADWGNRVLSAMRHAFGGHLEKSPEQ